MQAREIFDGVFKVNGKMATVNMAKGEKVYGEDLVTDDGTEYRLWNPYRSKLAAAILKGMRHMEIKKGTKVLYLGAATGTTSSHVSDIVSEEGQVYCIEISERSMRDLVRVCEKRDNMFPILEDARNAERYASEIETPDVLYQDIAARDQAQILLLNAKMLRKGSYAYVAIKSQSISVSKNPKQVYKEFLKSISVSFEVIESMDLAPFDRMHLFAVLKKR